VRAGLLFTNLASGVSSSATTALVLAVAPASAAGDDQAVIEGIRRSADVRGASAAATEIARVFKGTLAASIVRIYSTHVARLSDVDIEHFSGGYCDRCGNHASVPTVRLCVGSTAVGVSATSTVQLHGNDAYTEGNGEVLRTPGI
jgi:hypothetical protein